MKVVLAGVGAFALTATLVGCGDSSNPRLDPDVAGKPTWGACSQFSEQAMSIAEGAQGAKTLVAALSDYREAGDHVVRAPASAGTAHRWLIDESGTIHADLEVWNAASGWFVTGAKRCAD